VIQYVGFTNDIACHNMFTVTANSVFVLYINVQRACLIDCMLYLVYFNGYFKMPSPLSKLCILVARHTLLTTYNMMYLQGLCAHPLRLFPSTVCSLWQSILWISRFLVLSAPDLEFTPIYIRESQSLCSFRRHLKACTLFSVSLYPITIHPVCPDSF